MEPSIKNSTPVRSAFRHAPLSHTTYYILLPISANTDTNIKINRKEKETKDLDRWTSESTMPLQPKFGIGVKRLIIIFVCLKYDLDNMNLNQSFNLYQE